MDRAAHGESGPSGRPVGEGRFQVGLGPDAEPADGVPPTAHGAQRPRAAVAVASLAPRDTRGVRAPLDTFRPTRSRWCNQ
ncbi:hypothetical protein [Streptomyces sp. NPDC018610]|uniref:hypothetical protein n=1 Tax=Streptomyces sp. NPDC018610 TaxID=3365049 RepID=UPI0037BCE958